MIRLNDRFVSIVAISMTSDEGIAAIGGAIGRGRNVTLLIDIKNMRVTARFYGWWPIITRDKYVIAATNRRTHITIYQVRSCSCFVTF